MMHDVGMADVLFILLILGVVHGIMHWISRLRNSRNKAGEPSRDEQPPPS